MDKKDEELKRLLEEDLKRKMAETEFNNTKEDIEVTNEEKEKDVYQKKDEKKNRIIIYLGICIAILVIVLLIVLFSGNKSNNEKTDTKENSNEQTTKTDNNKKENDDNNTTSKYIDEKIYNYADAKVLYNKYIVIKSHDNNKIAVADLDGNVIFETKSSWNIISAPDKSLYAYNRDTNEVTIKKIKDDKVTNIFSGKATSLLVENKNLIGAFKENEKNDTLYIINGDSYETIDLEQDNYGAYTYNLAQDQEKNIYNSKYLITYSKKSDSYGLYDIKAKKQLIKNTYDKLVHLHDDIYVAEKNDKAGIINKDNKELLSFKYKFITYENGLYFAGQNNNLEILDSNFKDLNAKIQVQDLNRFTYYPCCGSVNPFSTMTFKNNVIIKMSDESNTNTEYVAVDKKGNITPLGKGNGGFVGSYFVKSNPDNNFIELYDENMTVKHKIDVGKKNIPLDNINIYLTNTLVIDNRNLYDLTKDTSKGTTSWYRRTSKDFEVRIDFKGPTGTVTISNNGEVLKKLENVNVYEFLKTENNGITITKNYFIYNAGGVAVIKMPEEALSKLLDFTGGKFNQ